MATYWKSQPRKFCEHCKCWITDNKPSVDFHEKGKNHQQNVKRRIDEIRKRSQKDAETKQELDDDMQKMEKAALEAFKKDLTDNPELAAQYRVRIPANKDSEKDPSEELVEYGPSLPDHPIAPPVVPDTDEWYEALSPEGYTYYWHTITAEVTWEKPAKFTSLTGDVVTNTDEDNAPESPDLTLDINDIPLPGSATKSGSDDIPAPTEPERRGIEPTYTDERSDTSRVAYGQWESVDHSVPELVDLQLPEQPVENIPLPPPSFTIEEQKLKFKEKRVTSLGDNSSGVVAFKKRKIMNKSRNTRKRDDDDN